MLPSWLPGVGALSFMLSDCAIVFNRFYAPVPNAQSVIMATYYFGQLLIATSLIGIDGGEGGDEKKAQIKVVRKRVKKNN